MRDYGIALAQAAAIVALASFVVLGVVVLIAQARLSLSRWRRK